MTEYRQTNNTECLRVSTAPLIIGLSTNSYVVKQLPTEILHLILLNVSKCDNKHSRVLLTCSLVSRQFLHLSRMVLFRTTRVTLKNSESLLNFFHSSPQVSSYVRNLTLEITKRWYNGSTNVEPLSKILFLSRSTLRELMITHPDAWHGLSDPIEEYQPLLDEIQCALREGMLESLSVSWMDFDSIDFLQELFRLGRGTEGRLRRLEFNRVYVHNDYRFDSGNPLALPVDMHRRISPQILVLGVMAASIVPWLLGEHCAVDLSELKELHLVNVNIADVAPLWQDARVGASLEKLKVEISNEYVVETSGITAKMIPSSIRSLEFKYKIPLHICLPYTLSILSSLDPHNTIEDIQLSFNYKWENCPASHYSPHHTAWSKLYDTLGNIFARLRYLSVSGPQTMETEATLWEKNRFKSEWNM